MYRGNDEEYEGRLLLHPPITLLGRVMRMALLPPHTSTSAWSDDAGIHDNISKYDNGIMYDDISMVQRRQHTQ